MSQNIFKILSNPTRIKILKVLSKAEMCACEIPLKVGKSQPNVSQQLKFLSKYGILTSRRNGKMILYKIKNKNVLKIIKLAEKMEVGKK